MGRYVLLVIALFTVQNLFSQINYADYKGGAEFECFGERYRVINNNSDSILDYNMCIVGLENVSNYRIEPPAQYVDGRYTYDVEETNEIIKHSSSYERIFRHAMRNAFNKSELESFPKRRFTIMVAVDNQGNILETATIFMITKQYCPQPEQIAALETMIRKNLKFELDQEKASKYNYFSGVIKLYFGKYMNELPEGMVEEPTDDLYTIRVAVNEIGSFTPSLGSGSGPLRP